MNLNKLEARVRAAVVVLFASFGLLASTPSVHGKADTRGGAPCDVNKTMNPSCGDTGYSGKCLYTYTLCYAVPGWRFMTCIVKPIENNNCERDRIRCFPRDDFKPVANCTAAYSAAGAAVTNSTSTATRSSQVE
jgi:hypothetical protein